MRPVRIIEKLGANCKSGYKEGQRVIGFGAILPYAAIRMPAYGLHSASMVEAAEHSRKPIGLAALGVRLRCTQAEFLLFGCSMVKISRQVPE